LVLCRETMPVRRNPQGLIEVDEAGVANGIATGQSGEGHEGEDGSEARHGFRRRMQGGDRLETGHRSPSVSGDPEPAPALCGPLAPQERVDSHAAGANRDAVDRRDE
jgi:hypothetical protein